MLSPDSEYLTNDQAVEQLYDRVTTYYDLQIQAIGPEEYKIIQKACNYPENYKEHIQNLIDTMKPSSETKEHIKEFLTVYPEFCHPQYISVLDYVINVIETQPEKAKQAGMQALMNVQRGLEEANEGKEIPKQSVGNIPEFIPFQIGTQAINVPSYQDPLMVSLYSVCFMTFAERMTTPLTN